MDIVLSNNLILIRTDFETLEQEWFKEFLQTSAGDTIFLPRALLVLYSDQYNDEKERFLRKLCTYYTTVHGYDEEFYLKSFFLYKNQPIKIELPKNRNEECVNIDVFETIDKRIGVEFVDPNMQVQNFFISQLEEYVYEEQGNTLLFELDGGEAFEKFERVLLRTHLFHFRLLYCLEPVISKIFDIEYDEESYSETSFDDEPLICAESVNNYYYKVLECEIGASQEELRKNYKKLVKIYHPDLVFNKSEHIVNKYTKKFQQLQEAYEALRIVS